MPNNDQTTQIQRIYGGGRLAGTKYANCAFPCWKHGALGKPKTARSALVRSQRGKGVTNRPIENATGILMGVGQGRNKMASHDSALLLIYV